MESNTEFLATIVNYGFSEQADRLKRLFSDHFPTLLIDNSSQPPPQTADIILPNRYYVGLWNEAVGQAIQRGKQWLILCASDVEMDGIDALARCIKEASEDHTIGLYSPSLRTDSRTSFADCYCRGTGGMRQCHVVEGFFFVCRVRILETVYPVDCAKHRYGWGIDVYTAFQALRLGYATVVDDRTVIYHPKSVHEIDEEKAFLQSRQICHAPEYQSFCQRIWRAQLLSEQINVRSRLNPLRVPAGKLGEHIAPPVGKHKASKLRSRFLQWVRSIWPSLATSDSRSIRPIEGVSVSEHHARHEES